MDELKKDENPYSIEVAKRKSIWTLSINPDEGGDELAKTEYDAFDKRITRLGFTGNPYKTDSTLTGLYYIKPSGLPEPILKRISTTDSLVGSILLARQKQVSQFGRRQEDRLSLGFGIVPDKRIFDKMSKEEKEDIEKKIEKACKTIETCGKTDGYLRTEAMNFSQWLEESARSALIVGRIATEIINDDDGYFHSFRPLDAGTVFPTVKTASANQLEDIRERSISLLQNIYGGSRSDYIDAVDGSYDWDRYEWIQLLDGKAIQCFTDDQLRCKNFYPVSDFEWFGFPVTPLDLAINEVLTHISITAHNKLFFQSGRAARGMIIIQSDDVDAQVLLQIRNEFMAAVNSVNNCIDGSSTIWTQESGRTSVVDYLGGSKEKLCTIWTGKEWNPALVYKTGVKQLAVTQLSNNVTLKTSPDHRFRVINDVGEPDWKRQEDLKIGDYVFVNKVQVENSYVSIYNNHEVDNKFAEILGWMTGDGSITDRSIRLFYHHNKERWIRDRHSQFLTELGIEHKIFDVKISKDEQESIKKRYGFKSCADNRIGIAINSKETVSKILKLGFNISSKGKCIPKWMFTTRTYIKSSFLKGFFSADGNVRGRTPTITITNKSLRNECKQLLLTLGIRTSLSEGKTKIVINGDKRAKAAEPSWLAVGDKDLFYRLVGFLQKHKQQPTYKNSLHSNQQNRIPKHLGMKWGRFLSKIDDNTKLLSKKDRSLLLSVARGEDRCSLDRLLRLFKLVEVTPPEWLVKFQFEEVVKTELLSEHTEMYDVSVYEPTHDCKGYACKSPEHAFMCDGILLANSHRMPVFGIGPEDKLTWQPIDNSSRDMEYQYLSDNNARAILSAFQMSPEELPGMAHLSRGTNNQSLSECLDLSSRVYQVDGYNTIGSILGDEEEVFTEIWDGREYTKCRIFKSGLKRSVKTVLSCGVEIITSPDHKFMVVNEHGDIEWKIQQSLKANDYILVSKSNAVKYNLIPEFNGKPLSLDMMEYIGWIIGDGTIVAPRKRAGGYIVSFYQPHNELVIRDLHERNCNEFGIKFDKKDKIVTNEEKNKLKKQFNSVSDVRILGYVRDTKFIRWLMSLGFNPSSRKKGKNIPSFIYTLPMEYRCAFLRGLFSADGGKLSTKNHIALTCQNDSLRDQVRHLLLSVGIRTNNCEGVNRVSFGKKRISYKLYIKDRDVFWKTVGFVQSHKQFEGKEEEYINKNNKDLPKSLVNKYLQTVINSIPKRSLLLDKRLRSNINTVLHSARGCTLSWLKAIESLTSIPLPMYTKDFYLEKVVEIIDLDNVVEMADVEMFNESHGFIANGFYVHNSNKEYLLEAHRDTGIRPLLLNLEEFVDQQILPLIDFELSKVAHFKLLGLDAKTLDQEDADETRNLSLDGSINHVRQTKQRPPIPKELAGDLPLNQAWWAVVQQMVPFGVIQEVMFGVKDASKDPSKQFYQNPFWFQYQQMLQAQKQMEAQQQQLAQAAQNPQQQKESN